MNNDLISRSALIAEFERIYAEHYKCTVYQFIHDIFKAMFRRLKNAPSVDAVEVVRCKDCIRCGFCGDATNLEVMGFYGYCSRGKRREDG